MAFEMLTWSQSKGYETSHVKILIIAIKVIINALLNALPNTDIREAQ
jgi:hypothetical protein